MDSVSQDLTQAIFAATKIAHLAATAILEIYHRPHRVESKPDGSPLTEADVAANQIIESGLKQVEVDGCSSIPILSEESKAVDYAVRKNWLHYWLVDPLDGTKEFLGGNGEFTVNIALVYLDRPIAGVIVVPTQQTLYFATNQLGAYRLDYKSIDFPAVDCQTLFRISEKLTGRSSIERPFTVIGSRSHFGAESEQFIEELKSSHPELELINAGSSLKFCRVAEGAADLYPRLGRTMEWDTAAGDAIVSAVGKNVLVYGSEQLLSYNKTDLANPWFIVS